ncbi:PspC domain-containing protein, partial [candidate division KSB1 bacterium]|nr:PspC domain-containing protein [candidate division KSB1 bacterium]
MQETRSGKLYRSQRERIIAGVCGGFADYFSIDVALIRVLWAVLSLFNGLGILLYIACVIIVPVDPTPLRKKQEKSSNRSAELTLGLLLLMLGLVFLMRPIMQWNFFPPFLFINHQNYMALLPLVLIII